MKIILLSGGSGKRLWPLSNDSRSKQFLNVLPGADGTMESMVKRVWGQIGRVGMREHTYIATSKPQVEMIQSQLGNEIELIVEPERRDTFPAIALAATYLYSIQGVSTDETVVVMPVDPYVEESFFEFSKRLEDVLNESGANLALMGVKPTHPSEKYGYIVPDRLVEDANASGYLKVGSFKEKPTEEEAAELIGREALWNCGVFAFKLDFLINALIAQGYPIQYDEMQKQYGKLPKISFDYEIVERSTPIVALPYSGEWKDLGTWNTLTEEMNASIIGKGIIAGNSSGAHVINELDIPITLLGLSNIVVAASPDGILVSDKPASPMIKEVMKHSDQRPMYEERRWGRYRVLDYLKYPDGKEVLTKRICIAPEQNLSYQYHELRSEVWTVIAGEGEMAMNGQLLQVRSGDVLTIGQGSKHSLRAHTEMEIIEVQTGTQLIEEDIVRLAYDWNEIVTLCSARNPY